MLGGDLLLPVGVGDLSLLEAVLGEVCVGPNCGAVAIQFGPVALDVCQIRVDKSDLLLYLTFQAGVP